MIASMITLMIIQRSKRMSREEKIDKIIEMMQYLCSGIVETALMRKLLAEKSDFELNRSFSSWAGSYDRKLVGLE